MSYQARNDEIELELELVLEYELQELKFQELADFIVSKQLVKSYLVWLYDFGVNVNGAGGNIWTCVIQQQC